MPQLDPTWFVSQFFWLCVCFFVMLFLMSKVFVPKIVDILELRQRKIDSYLVKAHQIKEQAEDALTKYKDALAKATEDANQSVEATRAEMNAYISKQQNELNAKLEKRLQEGEAKINEIHNQALKNVEKMAGDLALEIVDKIGVKKISSKDVEQTIQNMVRK